MTAPPAPAPDDLIKRARQMAAINSFPHTAALLNQLADAIAARDAEIERLTKALRRKDDGLNPCPFMGGYTAMRYDEPCPVCGDLGTTKESDSKCVAAERKDTP